MSRREETPEPDAAMLNEMDGPEDEMQLIAAAASDSPASGDDFSDLDEVHLDNGKYKVRLVRGRNIYHGKRALKCGVISVAFAVVVLICGLLIHYYGPGSDSSSGSGDVSQVVKAPRDQAQYRVFNMPSGLTVLLISDNSTADLPAAVSMNVGIGSLADPDAVPGLAHFLEHMLFMGTDKYPDEDGFSHFLSTNGGYYNAYTGSINTNFYFRVNQEALERALDMFTQFFMSPRLSATSVSREMHAVDSEYRKDIPQDAWRNYRLTGLMADPATETHRFTIGSLETLGQPGTRDHLRQFFNDHYTADKLTLGIWSTESLATLEKLARTFSAGIPAKTSPTFVPKQPYTGAYQGRIAHFTTTSGKHTIEILFPVQSLLASYRSNPASYINWLLGHEAKGTVLAKLRLLGWATSLSAGVYEDNVGFSLLSVDISVTDLGSQYTTEILGMLFQYIQLIQTSGVNKTIWDEVQTLDELSFRFLKPYSNTMDEISGLTKKLSQIARPVDLLSPPSRQLWDSDLLQKVLRQMTPDRAIITIGGPSTSFLPLYDPVFQLNYSLTAIPVGMKLSWQLMAKDPYFSLPPANSYLPRVSVLDQNSVQPAIPVPKLLSNEKGQKLWWYPNHEFPFQPQVAINIFIYTGWRKAATDPVYFYAMQSLWKQIVSQTLDTNIYNAKLAGFSYSFEVEPSYVHVTINGYADDRPLTTFLETVLHEVYHPNLSDLTLFNQSKTILATALKLYDRSTQIYAQGRRFKQMVVLKYNAGVRPLDVLPFVEAMTPSMFANFLKTFFAEGIAQVWFVHGSTSQAQALAHFKTSVSYVTAPTLDLDKVAHQQTMNLASGSSYTFRTPSFDPEDVNSVVEDVLQLGDSCQVTSNDINAKSVCSADSVKRTLLVQLLGLLIEDQCFNQLRTVEQLGYIVQCAVREYHGEFHLLSVVVSPDYNVSYVEEHIRAFHTSFVGYVRDVVNNSTRFANLLAIKKRLLQQKDTSFAAVTSRLLKEVSRFRFHFNIQDQILAVLKKLTNPSDLLTFYENAVTSGGRLSLQVFSQQKPASVNGTGTLTTANLESWRATQPYVPLKLVTYGV